jgi:hypothetical protein
MSSEPRKPRNIVRFREREVARVTKAVREAGGGIVTLNPVTGHYTIVVAGEGGMPVDTATENPWDGIPCCERKAGFLDFARGILIATASDASDSGATPSRPTSSAFRGRPPS